MEKKSLLKSVDLYLNHTNTYIGKGVDLILFVANLFACYLFVKSIGHAGELPNWLILSDYIVVSVFILEYILRIAISKNKLSYIISFYGIIDLLSIFPSFVHAKNFAFVRGFKVFRILRFFRFLENEIFFFGKINRIQLMGIKTLFVTMTILFISSGFILIFEWDAPNTLIKSFSDAFYYCVTTLSTVGFGDIVPTTEKGRMLTVIMILMGAVFIPWQAGKLVRALIIQDRDKTDVSCDKCGLLGHDHDASHCKACGNVIFQNYTGEA